MLLGQRLSFHSEKVTNNQIGKVVFGKNQSVKKTSESGIHFVNAHHPKVKVFRKLIKDLLSF